MSVTTMNLGSGEEFEDLQYLAASLGIYRKAGAGAGTIGSIPEFLKTLGNQDPKVIATAIGYLLPDETIMDEVRKIRVADLSVKQAATLREIARLTNCFQTRGVGTGRTGNISTLLRRMVNNVDEIEEALKGLDIEWVEAGAIEYQGEFYASYQSLADELGISRQAAYKRVNP